MTELVRYQFWRQNPGEDILRQAIKDCLMYRPGGIIKYCWEKAVRKEEHEYEGLLQEEAQYVVPLAWRTRVFLTMNWRELHHMISIRSSRQGHASYRRVAQAMYREVERVLPGLASFVRVDLADYELSRA